VVDVGDRAQPANADMGLGIARFDLQVGHGERHIRRTHAQLAVARLVHRIVEGRADRRKDRAMQPRGACAVHVEPGLTILRADRVIIAMLHIIFACPGYLDRLADLARDQCRLDHEIWLRLAPEGPAQPGRCDLDVLLVDPQRLGERLARALRVLHAGPAFEPVAVPLCGRARWLHRRLVEVRRVIFRRDPCFRRSERCRHIAARAAHLAAAACRGQQLPGIAFRIIAGIGSVLPCDLQRAASFNCGPGIACDHRYAAQCLELGWRLGIGQAHGAQHTCDRARFRVVHAADPAEQLRRPGDHRMDHTRTLNIDPVGALPRDDARHRQRGNFAVDVTPLLGGLELDVGLGGYLEPPGQFGQIAIGQSVAVLRIADQTALGRALILRQFPVERGGSDQHLPHGGSSDPQPVEIETHRARTIGVLVAIALVPFGLNDLDIGPVGLELIGHDLRHRGPDLLTHLRTVAGDLDRTILVDRDPERRRGVAAIHFGQRAGPGIGQIEGARVDLGLDIARASCQRHAEDEKPRPANKGAAAQIDIGAGLITRTARLLGRNDTEIAHQHRRFSFSQIATSRPAR